MSPRIRKTKTPKVRTKSITVGRLNITVHPHEKGVYQELLMRAYSLHTPIELVRKERAVLGPVKLYPDDNFKVFRIPIFRYYNLNPFGVWFDTLNQKAVKSTEENPLTNIPMHLKPDFRVVNAFLYVKKHEIIFDSKAITHSQAFKFFYTLFQHPLIVEEFGPVEVTIVQHPGMLETVLGVQNMHSVQFIVNRPNPDDDEEDDQRIEERMREMGIFQWNQTVSAKSRTRDPITKIDDELQSFGRAALRNGEVKSIGYDDEGKRLEVSSLETPYNEPLVVPTGGAFQGFFSAVKSQLDLMRR